MTLEAPLSGRELSSTRRPEAFAIVSVPAPRVDLETLLALEMPDARERFLWDASGHPGETTEAWAFAGRGVAHRIETKGADRFQEARDAITRLWSSVTEIPYEDESTVPTTRLFGGFSFDPRAADDVAWRGFGGGIFVLPRWLYASGIDRAFLRLVVSRSSDLLNAFARAREVAAQLEHATRVARAPSSHIDARVTEDTSLSEWTTQVENALSTIRDQQAEKLVTARRSVVSLSAELDVPTTMARLARDEASSIRFAFEQAGATFFGATPESLVRVRGLKVTSAALAGSRPRNLVADAAPEGAVNGTCANETRELLASEKDQREHAHVVEGIVTALRPLAKSIEVAAMPTVRTLASVHHLETPIRATLATHVHVLDVVQAMHPTPAVCGTPRNVAQDWITHHEPVSRGFYAAPVGWVDRDGNGSFAVAIRSAIVRDRQAWVYAGAGIVVGSAPELEYRETTAKLRTMLHALGALP